MPDPFSSRSRRPADPPVTVFDITPSDTADLDRATVALNVAATGTVRVTTVDGSVSDVEIRSGESFPLRVKRVWLTGTTATGIRGLS